MKEKECVWERERDWEYNTIVTHKAHLFKYKFLKINYVVLSLI